MDKVKRIFCLVAKCKNREDPFTLEKIEGTRFFHISEEGVFQFEPENLVEYIKSGNYCNPFTKKEFNFLELKRLILVYKKKYPNQTVPELIKTRDKLVQEKKQKIGDNDLLDTLINEAKHYFKIMMRPNSLIDSENILEIIDMKIHSKALRENMLPMKESLLNLKIVNFEEYLKLFKSFLEEIFHVIKIAIKIDPLDLAGYYLTISEYLESCVF